jgi:O-antigen/teichoic acid export membrane protein
MGLSQGSLFVVQFVVSAILARLLTPYEMGIYAVAVAIVGLLSIIRALGLPAYLVRLKELDEALLASVFTVNAIIGVLLSCVIAGLSVLGGALLGEPGVRHSLLVMAIVPLLGVFDFLPAALIERAGNFRSIAVMTIVRALVVHGTTLALAFAGYSYMSLVYGQLIGAVVSVLGFNIIGWRHVRLRIGFTEWREVMTYALQMVGISGVTIFAARMSELVLGRLLGLDALGLFSRASGLSNTLWDSVHLMITRIIFVDFSNQVREGKTLRTSYLAIIRMMTALLWPAFGGLGVLAGPVVLVVYGETWLAAATPLSLLCVAAMVLVSITMTWEVFNVSQQTARQAKIEFIRAGAGLALFVGGCLVSMNVAAFSRIGEALFSAAIYRPDLERMTGTSWPDLVPIYLESAGLTLLAVGPAAIVMGLYGWSPATPLGMIAAGILAGLAAWFCGMGVRRHPLFREICAVLPFRMGRRA